MVEHAAEHVSITWPEMEQHFHTLQLAEPLRQHSSTSHPRAGIKEYLDSMLLHFWELSKVAKFCLLVYRLVYFTRVKLNT